MPNKEPHFVIRFAARFGSPVDEYLNAWTALARLDELIEDAKALKELFDRSKPESERWHPWFGAEIASYYAVGIVTCLEWHARARLVDLLTFRPSAARSDDLRIIKDKVVLEMLAANVTIASIVGAATNISNLDEYLNVFSRVFSAFGTEADGFKVIKAQREDTGTAWVAEHEINDLKNLYAFRNRLVHEIGIERVGHPNVRDCWSPEEAVRIGEIVRRTMKGLEALISAKMPPGFPNLLGADGYPASEADRLEAEMPILEGRIARITTAFTDAEVAADENWGPAKAAAADYLDKEKRFLEHASMLHNRYVEMRGPLKLALMKSRHSYLSQVLEIVGGVWELPLAEEMSKENPPK